MANPPLIERHTLRRRPPELPDGFDQLSPESQAALRQAAELLFRKAALARASQNDDDRGHGAERRDIFTAAANLYALRVVVYSDADHCIYKHPAEKHDLTAEFIRAAARGA